MGKCHKISREVTGEYWESTMRVQRKTGRVLAKRGERATELEHIETAKSQKCLISLACHTLTIFVWFSLHFKAI